MLAANIQRLLLFFTKHKSWFKTRDEFDGHLKNSVNVITNWGWKKRWGEKYVHTLFLSVFQIYFDFIYKLKDDRGLMPSLPSFSEICIICVWILSKCFNFASDWKLLIIQVFWLMFLLFSAILIRFFKILISSCIHLLKAKYYIFLSGKIKCFWSIIKWDLYPSILSLEFWRYLNGLN